MRLLMFVLGLAVAACSFAPDLSRFPACGEGGRCPAGSTCLSTAGRCIPDCGGVDPEACLERDAGVDGGVDAGVDGGVDAGADAGFDGGTDGGFQFLKATPAPGVETKSYSYTFTTSGGTPPITFALAGGSSLPAGVSLSATGLLSSSALPAGTFSFTVQATDSSSPARSTQVAATLTVDPLLRLLTPSRLPDAVVGQQYFEVMDVVGGIAPYSMNFSSGQYPPGVGLSTTPPRVVGNPTTPGAYGFAVTLSETPVPGQFVNRSFALDVVSPDGGLVMLTRALNDGKVGHTTSVKLRATGGTPPYLWQVVGQPVAGYSIADPVDAGTWLGNPAVPGGATVSLSVTDAVGASVQRSFNFTVF